MKVRRFKRTFLKELAAEIKVARYIIYTNILSAVQLRFAFFLQAGGMIINNTAFLIAWLLFSNAFGSINGWGAQEIIALQGIVGLVYGICFTFFGGIDELASKVNNGSFDSLLLTPRSLYLRILTLTTKTSAIGDMIYGLLILIVFGIQTNITFSNTLILILAIIPACIIFVNFAFTAATVSFFIPDAHELSRSIFDILLTTAMYPGGTFQGIMRFIFMFIVPALFIGSIPVEIVTQFSLYNLLAIWIIALVWFLLARLALINGVKRYESGNMIGAR